MHGFHKMLAILLILNATLMSGCGTLLYPERTGQNRGRIDPAVAILDGVGVLFYVIPGLVAFAIDFHNGTIYLPGGRVRAISADGGQSRATDGQANRDKINRAVSEELGIPDIFNDKRLVVSALKSNR